MNNDNRDITPTHNNDNNNNHPARIEPKVPIDIRLATTGPKDEQDLKFIDKLQSQYPDNLGWLPFGAIRGHIEKEHVLIAQTPPPTTSDGKAIPNVRGVPLGYIIGVDEYCGRTDVGAIYQVCVADHKHRSLIGAMLVQAFFDHVAYGVKLVNCWCAQDLDSNYFWEKLGFVPLAFRTGSARKKGEERIHIFWQKKIREDDHTATYWYPYKTKASSKRSERLAILIPPGTHWSDAKPAVVPELMAARKEEEEQARLLAESEKKLLGSEAAPPSPPKKRRKKRKPADASSPINKKTITHTNGFRLTAALANEKEAASKDAAEKSASKKKAKAKPKKPKAKFEKATTKAARKLAAKHLEALATPEGQAKFLGSDYAGDNAMQKYDVRRSLATDDACDGLNAIGFIEQSSTQMLEGNVEPDCSDDDHVHDGDYPDIIDAEFTVIEREEDDADDGEQLRDAA